MKISSLVLLLLPFVFGCATPPPVLCGPGPTFSLNVDRSQEVTPPVPAKQQAAKDAAVKTAAQAPAPARSASLPESTPSGAKRIKLYYAQPARRDSENCPSVTFVERDVILGASPAQTVMFELLEPERIGVELSEEFQLHPEQSTSALIFHHPQAGYFNAT